MTADTEPARMGSVHVPEPFGSALEGIRATVAAGCTAGLVLREVDAPKRLAPYALAVAADVERSGQSVATGRLVVLHDPDGQEAWHGATRVVVYVCADMDAEMAADPALAEVGWSWLSESLRDREAPHTAVGGTVTRTVSVRFGAMSDADEVSEVEIRASWTALPGPDGRLDLDVHLQAWCDLLCATAGLPPPGVSALPVR